MARRPCWTTFRGAELFIEGRHTFFACDAFDPMQVLSGGGAICPRAQ
jgi:hypothetical protein